MFSLARCSFRPTFTRPLSTAVLSARQKWGVSPAPAPKSIFDDDERVIDLTEDDDAVNGIRPGTTPVHRRSPSLQPTPTPYMAHRETLKSKFPAGWSPPRKISREAMDGLRDLHRHDPNTFSVSVLADKFRISPEAVSKILKSKWQPSKERRDKQMEKERQRRAELHKQTRQEELLEEHKIMEEKKWSGRRPGRRDTLALE